LNILIIPPRFADDQPSTATITSEALLTATADLPLANLSSSTASLVMEAAVTVIPPPTSIQTREVGRALHDIEDCDFQLITCADFHVLIISYSFLEP
jgi:hypothetical protein